MFPHSSMPPLLGSTSPGTKGLRSILGPILAAYDSRVRGPQTKMKSEIVASP